MAERLQKILSARGVCSRRKAEELIQNGCVSINGRIASLGETADPEKDDITVNGQQLPVAESYVYIMLHKPRGYVTTLSDEKGRPNVTQLVDCGHRVYPVGRLDMDSEGLLLLTNDGTFANKLMHPKQEVEKVYEVWTKGYRQECEALLRRPISLDGYTIHPPKVQLLNASGGMAHFRIIIHEGRNRQVRRMCQTAGMTVTRLRRIAEGTLQLGTLKKGTWRYLTQQELDSLEKF